MDHQTKAKELFVKALIHLEAGQPDSAESLLREAERLMPGRESILTNLAAALIAQKKFPEALRYCDEVLAISPDSAVAAYNKGATLVELESIDEALICLEHSLSLNPNYAEALSTKGIALERKGELQLALDCHNAAIQLDSKNPVLYVNRGTTLAKLDRSKDALRDYDFAITLQPENHHAHNNRGNALLDLNLATEAVQSFQRAIALEPRYVRAQWNCGLALLTSGNFESGWANLEARWQDSKICGRSAFERPAWRGEDINGKTILLHAEQGFGDTIQFSRYAQRVASLGARVTCSVQPALQYLLAESCSGFAEVTTSASILDFEFHCPFMSLPYAFRTDFANIPASVPYLRTPSARQQKWRSLLSNLHGIKIGLVWSGNPLQENDRNRSMTLSKILPLTGIDATFISLQKAPRPEDAQVLRAHPDILDFSEQIDDFADTAALIEELDLVISVCTSVAHLAGALGKPLWVLLPFAADWRWFLERSDSPWYPSATLFRQPEPGNWDAVISGLQGALAARIGVQ